MAHILVVDDDLVYLDELSDGLRSVGYNVECAASAKEAMVYLHSGPCDLVICDTIMAGGGAVSLLHDVRMFNKDLPFVVITGRPEIATSPLFIEGMREANAKIEKSSSLLEIDKMIRSLLPT